MFPCYLCTLCNSLKGEIAATRKIHLSRRQDPVAEANENMERPAVIRIPFDRAIKRVHKNRVTKLLQHAPPYEPDMLADTSHPTKY